MSISMAITTFNRFEMTVNCFAQIIDDDFISEFIIVDDASTDGSSTLLKNYFRYHPKVKVFVNKENIGMSRNKELAIRLCKEDWVIIFDSDNGIDKNYLNAIGEVGELDKKTMYLPVWAMPQFNYSKYSGLLINKDNVKAYMNEDMFRCSLNTCNCLVNRHFYLSTFKVDNSIGCADTINHVYNHLQAGGSLYFVPNLTYKHVVHNGSGFLQDINYNLSKAKEIEKKIISL